MPSVPGEVWLGKEEISVTSLQRCIGIRLGNGWKLVEVGQEVLNDLEKTHAGEAYPSSPYVIRTSKKRVVRSGIQLMIFTVVFILRGVKIIGGVHQFCDTELGLTFSH